MKNFKNLWAIALLLAASFVMVSCDDDEPIIEVGDGLAVADGFYFTVDGEDPVAEKALLPEKVEGEGFAAVDRDGFFGNYVFLEAGDYQLQKVESREIASTVGGTLAEPTDSTQSGYLIAKTTVDGSALNVASSGYYKVSYDETLSELIMMKVTSVSIIGNATPNGWSTDTQIAAEGTASDDGFSFSSGDIDMVAGEFKIRINNRWTIDRRTDRTATEFDPNNGYVAFTNYGGDVANLIPGGSNMIWTAEDRGVYTIEIDLSNDVGASFSSNKTGDITVEPFDPEENKWAVAGAATPLGWPAGACGDEGEDVDMTYEGEASGTYTWTVEVVLAVDEFKFRPNDCWDDGELNFSNTTVAGPDAANITNPANGNMKNNVAGNYKIIVTTSDEGVSYTANFELLEASGTDDLDPEENKWAVVGGATTLGWPAGNCGDAGEDIDMTYAGKTDGTHTWTVEVDLAVNEFKFRPNDCWADGELNFGNTTIVGSAAANITNPGNGNMSNTVAGTYDIVLTTSDEGASYTADFSIQ